LKAPGEVKKLVEKASKLLVGFKLLNLFIDNV